MHSVFIFAEIPIPYLLLPVELLPGGDDPRPGVHRELGPDVLPVGLGDPVLDLVVGVGAVGVHRPHLHHDGAGRLVLQDGAGLDRGEHGRLVVLVPHLDGQQGLGNKVGGVANLGRNKKKIYVNSTVGASCGAKKK